MKFDTISDNAGKQKVSYHRTLVWVVGLAVLAVVLKLALTPGGGTSRSNSITVPVRRGPLEISVVAGGRVKAIQAQQVTCDVESWQGGGRKILMIVDEGRYVSQEDVDRGLVLVELDATDIKRQLTTMEIAFQGTEAALSDAQQTYSIQLNQSSSDIYTAELALKFARMDMEKYLGAAVMREILAPLKELEIDWDMDLERELAYDTQTAVTEFLLEPTPFSPKDKNSEQTGGTINQKEIPGEDSNIDAESVEAMLPLARPRTEGSDYQVPSGTLRMTIESSDATLALLRRQHPNINFSNYADSVMLGKGEANQRIRQLEDAQLVARRELGQSKLKLAGTERLHEKGFVTDMELENEKLDVDKRKIGVQSAEAAYALFKEYEFPKQAQKMLADYLQARAALGRTEKKAVSDITGARARRLAAEAQFRMEAEEIRRLKIMITKCVMRATGPGLVVYGGGREEWWNQQPVRKGAIVHEQQTIITIPDTTKMSVQVKIHEAEVTKVAIGQKVRISIGAHPDKKLTGKVSRVAVLPSSQDEWLNPDFKVYDTVIEIDGSHDWLKPGMSAKAEIIAEKLDDVLYIPIQSAVPQGDHEVCFVPGADGPEPRYIQTGAMNIEFIVVTQGLVEGERVLLRPPEGSRQDETIDDLDENEEDLLRPLKAGSKNEARKFDDDSESDSP